MDEDECGSAEDFKLQFEGKEVISYTFAPLGEGSNLSLMRLTWKSLLLFVFRFLILPVRESGSIL